MKVLVTGNAGFIGFHVARALLKRGDEVVGYDAVNDYYDPSLKEARLQILKKAAQATGSYYSFIRANLADISTLETCFKENHFDRVIHLAAQAGVRYSITNPRAYVESNIIAFANILEVCRYADVPHLTYASTSSVYGANGMMPFSEHQPADHPLQFYAATKRANELMAHSYSSLFGLPTTGLRFFTVYGPWGRPDMALFLFTKAILEGRPVELFNNGEHSRDFTYIDDVVEGIIRSSDQPATPNLNWQSKTPDPATSLAPWRIFNIGNMRQVKLGDYVAAIESALGCAAERKFLPLQPGDVPNSLSDTTVLEQAVGYRPTTQASEGVERFVEWYKGYYGTGKASSLSECTR